MVAISLDKITVIVIISTSLPNVSYSTITLKSYFKI